MFNLYIEVLVESFKSVVIILLVEQITHVNDGKAVIMLHPLSNSHIPLHLYMPLLGRLKALIL
jgi:hypothetical protein